jgi:long-subunit fatty acid transport protein
MSSERWDLEANLVYEKNSVVEALDVVIEGLDPEQGSLLIPPGGINTTVRIGHNWQDQLSLRLGGDWNAIPAKLAARAGFSYETSGFTEIGSTRPARVARSTSCRCNVSAYTSG